MRWESSALAHYGIKGQQWGIRRFQNEDGTLTQAGKERYYKHLDEEDRVDNERMANAPNELAYHNSHKKELIEQAKKNGQDDANAKAWYEARKRVLEDQVRNAPRDKAFNRDMRKFLDSNSDVTIKDLRDQISKMAKKNGLDVDWMNQYYDQNLSTILGDGYTNIGGESPAKYKTDSNGIRYTDVADKKTLDWLYANSCVSKEGINLDSDYYRLMLKNMIQNRFGIDTTNLAYHTITGKTMNKEYGLTGDNAYQDDFHILSISGLPDGEKLQNLRTSMGMRWFDDIVDNNESRQQLLRH